MTMLSWYLLRILWKSSQKGAQADVWINEGKLVKIQLTGLLFYRFNKKRKRTEWWISDFKFVVTKYSKYKRSKVPTIILFPFWTCDQSIMHLYAQDGLVDKASILSTPENMVLN